MYSTQRLEVPSKPTMERMYSINSAMNGEGNMSHIQSPKKENMLKSMFNVLNVVWEHVARVPGTLVTNINNPLSVTVVQNDGIISHEFFKSLTNTTEPLTTDRVYIQDMPRKDSLNIIERIHYSMPEKNPYYTTSILNENMKENIEPNKQYMSSTSEKLMQNPPNGNDMTDKENCNNSVDHNKSEVPKELQCDILVPLCNSEMENKSKNLLDEDDSYKAENVMDTENLKDCMIEERKSVSSEQNICNYIQSSINTKLHTELEPSDLSPQPTVTVLEDNTIKPATITNLLTNMWQKVVSVTDRLYTKTDSVDQEVSVKRSYSPKQRRKVNTVAKGRGRGRARSQLRRSGVSQTRHRKERTKHDLVANIQDDYESWLEFEIYPEIQKNESTEYFTLNETGIDVTDAAEYVLADVDSSMSFTFTDLKPRTRKPKTRKIANQEVSRFPTRVRYVPESVVDTNGFYQDYTEKKYDSQRSAFRPRLMSESSVDSEDSYCIVFEPGSEVNYKSDIEESDEDQSTDDEDQSTEDDESTTQIQKVKFNLKPTVHIMVQWDYAYRAARRGPWEEMARDRERFRGRINCIERILNPILTMQHRTHIWQERFAIEQ